LKIAAYPNRIDPINLDSGKFKMRHIDIYHIYGRDNTITGTEKKAMEYTKRILENRITKYCNLKSEEYFDLSSNSMEDYHRLLYQVSINIPRVLGHILNDCYLKNIVYDKLITRNAILEASKQYYYDHVVSYFDKLKSTYSEKKDDKLDIFVQENLKLALINYAQKNKYELLNTSNSYFSDIPTVPTSHFTTLPENEQYLDPLEFNGFIHKLNIIAGKGREKNSYKNQNRILYCFDRGLCVDEKIDFGKPDKKDTKFYQQRAFEYDDIILITLKDNKKIVCKECGSNYSIEELEMFRMFNMKCKDTGCSGYCDVEFNRELKQQAEQKLSNAILSESEFEVIHAIMLLERTMPDDILTANLISKEIDYSISFIAWRCKKLEESGYIHRDKINESAPYIYSVSDRARSLMGEILSKEQTSDNNVYS
jgi:DNA-binding MarR family transcriptional regulator